MTDFARLRNEMVDRQLIGRGIREPEVLDAMRSVPREMFVPEDLVEYAYDDAPLPIGSGQTISQPYIVAYMIEALGVRDSDVVLEIGGGSGYAAAVLAKIAARVLVIERIEALAHAARENLLRAGFADVTVRCSDGSRGWPEEAPFDAILVSAGAPEVPAALVEQLSPDGRLVVPIGRHPNSQDLYRFVRGADGRLEEEQLKPVRFVPLVGAHGWPDDGRRGADRE